MHTYVHQGMYRMSPAALFILATAKNFPKGPLQVEWVNKWSIHTKEQYGDKQPMATCNNTGDSQTYC